MQTNFNEVVVLQHGERSSVNNSRPAGKEVTGTRQRNWRNINGSEGAIQKRTFNYFPQPRLKT